MRRTTLCILLFAMLPLLLPAQSVKELERQRKQTLEQLEQTGKMLKQTKRNETATENKLNLLQKDIRTRKQLIAGINSEINALDKELGELSQRKTTLQAELDLLKQEYARMVEQSHYAELQQSPLLFVLSADNFNQMLRRIRYMQEVAVWRRMQAEQIKEKQTEVEEQDNLLRQNRKQKQSVLQMQRREQDNLTRDQKKQQRMLQDLKKKEKDLLAQQKKQQAKANELNRKIDDLIKKQVKKDANKQQTKEEKLLAGGFEKNKGRLPWPTEKGYISGEFGIQPHPSLAHVTVNNRGVYIQTTAGAVARTVYEGEVSAIFVSDGQNVVIVKHGNYRTVYSNLTTLYVKTGDKLTAKQKIGKIYTDPNQDNKTELFFQIRKDTDVLNPSLWLAGA
ncbi:MAG: peptidoglycan DD-metalloendopeptidase family protein [Paludibacteraceae bacterium]|nr:peptidoglycan DD-metalloendopeptidase family protein [Paludibacteraceae bacterium]